MISFGSCIYPTLGSAKVSPSRVASPENYRGPAYGIFSGYFRLAAAMFEGSNVQWRLRKSAFRIAVQLRRQLYSKLFAYYKRTNTCVKIC